MEYVTLIEGILEEVLGLAPNVSTGGVQNIINILEKVIPTAVAIGQSLLTPIQNIIATLKSSAAATPAQIAALSAQSATVDAALDAAAKDDNLTGVGDDVTGS